MKIILAEPRGFCAGVNMAIAVVDEAVAQLGTGVYVYHEIVHNSHVVESFRSRGVHFVDSLDEVPAGSVLVFSAHGVSPAVREQARAKNLKLVDATCPLVTKVHSEVLRFVKEGAQVIFIGHRGHDETEGTVGEAPSRIRVIETAEEVDSLDYPPGTDLAYVSQTTLSVAECQRVVDRLRARFPKLRGPSRGDICYATTHRQEAVASLGKRADVVLVVGSANSSNSRRLVEVAFAMGKPAHLIDDASCLRREWVEGVKTVLITAGASAPEPLVRGVVAKLAEWYPVEIEDGKTVTETTAFALPQSLRTLVAERGTTP